MKSKNPECSGSWVELESDPGLFTLLVNDYGAKGVEVEEIYDLQAPFEDHTLGFIFLFKWIEVRRNRRVKLESLTAGKEVLDEQLVNSMFFAHQVIPNSCASHALLSILLNSSEDVDVGEVLRNFRSFTDGMTPECKGLAINNLPTFARIHNKYARPEAVRQWESDMKSDSQSGGITSKFTADAEQFHFVSYLPCNGRLYELDGLKFHPIDHGPIPPGDSWTDVFREVITQRIAKTCGDENEIRYNLMALIPCKKAQCQRRIETLTYNRSLLSDRVFQIQRAQAAAENSDRFTPVESGDFCDSQQINVDSLPQVVIAISPLRNGDLLANYCPPPKSASPPAELAENKLSVEQLDLCRDLLDHRIATISIVSDELINGWHLDASTSFDVETPGEDALLHDSSSLITFESLKRTYKMENKSLESILDEVDVELGKLRQQLPAEEKKLEGYRVENARRTHNYDPFIATFLNALFKEGVINEIAEEEFVDEKFDSQPKRKRKLK